MADMAVTDRGPLSEPQVEEGFDELEQFLATARKRFRRAEEAEQMNRQAALDDLKFKNGEQWPAEIRAQRTLDKRPCLTINKMKTFVHQITNDQRQNRPAINVSPVGDRGDPETAKMLKGLIRQIERTSHADIAYDTGFDNAVSNGWGFWRVLTEYESEGSFNLVAKIGRIRNPFRVYMDPDAQEPEASDAQWCFISDLMPREEFKEKYPDAEEYPWLEGTMGDEWKAWETQTHIRVAEYYCYETTKRRLVALANGHIGFEDELAPELQEAIKADPRQIVREREVMAKKVKWYTITSREVLDETDWPGKWIPVVRDIGDEVDIEGKVTFAGLIRDAKDPQRMVNYWETHKTEFIALQPKAPYIMEEGQVEGHEAQWRQANNKLFPYLLYKSTSIAGKPAPAPQRQAMPALSPALVEATQQAEQHMQATTGVRFDATLNERMYDESGKALRELKRVGDLGNFHYIDNLARSLRHTGRILIDIIPKVYDTRRVLTILREDDTEQEAIIDPTLGTGHKQQTDQTGKVLRIYNPKVGEYEVAVTIGPSYATKRSESADSMLNFVKAFPPAAAVAGDLIAKNMDWPGAEEIAARLQTTLPPALQDKSLENLPAEAKGVVGSLLQQLQGLKQERDKALALLGDKEKDREIDRSKIAADYDTKMTDIAAGFQETILKLLADQGQQNEAQLQKIAADFEAKSRQMVVDFVLEQQKMAQERELEEERMEQERELSADELAANVMVEGERIDSAERTADADRDSTERTAKATAGAKAKEGKQKKGESRAQAPVINIHIGGGKKKITKGTDGSYTSEEVNE